MHYFALCVIKFHECRHVHVSCILHYISYRIVSLFYKSPYASCLYFSNPIQPLGFLNHCSVFHLYCFDLLEYHKIYWTITQCVAFSDFLFSVNIMNLSFIHVAWTDSLLLLSLKSIALCVCTIVCLNRHVLKPASSFWQL